VEYTLTSCPIFRDHLIATSFYQEIRKNDGGALVAICKTMIGRHGMNQRCRLFGYWAIIAVIWTANCRLNQINADDALPAARLQGALVCA